MQGDPDVIAAYLGTDTQLGLEEDEDLAALAEELEELEQA